LSSRRALRSARLLFALVVASSAGSLGCWEQWSNEWWPQMKWQPAVQAFEAVDHQERIEPFSPPEGAVPVGGGDAPLPDTEASADALQNPRPMSLASLENGRTQYQTYCATCHGDGGLGDGPVSMTGDIQGPFAAVLPVAGPGSVARIRSDGHIYATIRYGRRRMPSYQRIPERDRWDIVNYIRHLNEQGSLQ